MGKDFLINLSKEELIDKISSLETQLIQFKEELIYQEQARFDWSGNLGKWQWNVIENRVSSNPKKVEALGYSLQEIPEEIGFEFFTSKIHPQDYEMVMQNMRDHLGSVSEAYECEYRIKCKNGQWKWYYDRGIVIKRDANNNPIELVGIVFDISNRKKAQKELELKNAQLLQLNENKNLMLSIIAHDLRGPLGALDLLVNEVLDVNSLAKQTDILKEFAASTHNLYSLADNLLEWATFQRGEFVLDYKELSILDVSELAIEPLELIAHKKNIRIINKINPLTKATFDEKMISTVFRNLVSNAIKYTPRDGYIELYDRVLNGKVEVVVKDNGIGIKEDVVKSIFAISSIKRTKGTEGENGTGLGLVLCKDFIEKNGGSIYVESEFGLGSSFIFSLPLKREE